MQTNKFFPTPLTISQKRELIANIAVGFVTEFPLCQDKLLKQEDIERNSIYQLVWDYFLFNQETLPLRNSLQLFYQNGKKQSTIDIAQFFYTPYTINQLFEKSIERVCIETNISKSDRLEKCYKMLDYLRLCQDDVSKNISVSQSRNTAAMMLLKIVYDYRNLTKTNQKTTTKQTTLLDFS